MVISPGRKHQEQKREASVGRSSHFQRGLVAKKTAFYFNHHYTDASCSLSSTHISCFKYDWSEQLANISTFIVVTIIVRVAFKY